jgi:hypothetical protein
MILIPKRVEIYNTSFYFTILINFFLIKKNYPINKKDTCFVLNISVSVKTALYKLSFLVNV